MQLTTGTHVLVVRIRPVTTPTGASWGSLILGGGWCGGNETGEFEPDRCRMAGFRQSDGSNFRLVVLQSAAAPVLDATNLGKPTTIRVVTTRGPDTIGGISVEADGVAPMEEQGSVLAPNGDIRRIVLAFGSTSTAAGTTNTATFRAEYAFARIGDLS
jgi:hypothetical protein